MWEARTSFLECALGDTGWADGPGRVVLLPRALPEPTCDQAGTPPQSKEPVVGFMSSSAGVMMCTERLPHSAPDRTTPTNGWSCLLAHSYQRHVDPSQRKASMEAFLPESSELPHR